MTRAVASLARALALALVAGCSSPGPAPVQGTPAGTGPAATGAGGARAKTVLRLGHFPNLTHVHGLVAHQLSRQAKGWFEERLGPDVTIEWFVYNAGPSAMEAMLAGALDATYVGPNPALNAHTRSGGKEVRIIAGATVGGAALVVQPDGRIKTPGDFRGKKVATPQLGNTQDVACRAWLAAQGFQVTQLGGDVQVVPTANPDQLALFQKGTIDAVWTVEPWVSRIQADAGGVVFLEEPDAVTTVLVASAGFLRDRRDLARALAAAHAELTAWIEANPGAAQELVRAELKAETSIEPSEELVRRAWGRMKVTSEVPRAGLDRFVAAAATAGFLPEKVDLTALVEAP